MKEIRCLSVAALSLCMFLPNNEAHGKCAAWISVLYRAYPIAPWNHIQVSDNDVLYLHPEVEYAVQLNSECWTLPYTVELNGVLVDSGATQAFLPPCCTGLIWAVTDTGSYQFNAWAQESASLNIRFVSSTELSSISFLCSGAWLSGAMYGEYNYARMRTTLSEGELVPIVEPFTDLGWSDETSGGESMAPAVQMDHYSRIVDWIRLELLEPNEPYELIHAVNLLLMRDGRLMDSFGEYTLTMEVPPGHYRMKILHRNHLPITTAPYFFPGNRIQCDLSVADLPIPTGDTRRPIGWNKWALLAGNAHVSPIEQAISYSGPGNDRDAILQRIGGTNPTATVSGYFNEDVNMDGVVKYSGVDNDRDVILQAIGGVNPTAVVSE